MAERAGPASLSVASNVPSDVAPAIEQQLELLRRTVEENERALRLARHTLGGRGELSRAEAEAIAGLRRVRLEIRAQTQQVHALLERDAHAA